MQVTRNQHASFMFKAMPLLTILYFIQAYFYLEYGPEALARDVVATMGLGLLGIFLFYYLYDNFHKVLLYPTYLEIKIAPLNIQHEYLYREIVDVEVRKSNVIIHLRNGDQHKLLNVDNADQIRKYLLERC